MTKKTRKQTTIRISRDRLESLDFRMCPADAGQMVEVTYACDESGVCCRRYDRSDRTTTYQFAAYSARATEAELAYEPQNGRLPRHNSWRDVVVG